MRLNGKICVITNGGEYMGPAITAEFLKEGALVVLQTKDAVAAARQLAKYGISLPEPGVADTVEERRALSVIEADFSQPGVADRYLSDLVKKVGRLDVLVNVNAHDPGEGRLLPDTDDALWESMLHSLMTELYYTCKAALKHMIPARRGKIVNVTSAAGVVGLPKYVPYSAARAGANGFTKALGKEMAPYNIQVNAIAQNFVENPTYFPDDLIGDPKIREKIVRKIPLGRLAKGEESAKLAVFLASDESDFLCGEVIKFTGGWG